MPGSRREDRVSAAASSPSAARRPAALPFPGDLVLTPVSRRPTRLEDSTLRTILDRAGARLRRSAPPSDPRPASSSSRATTSPFLRLCLESVLAGTERPCELIVVDNGSSDGTPAYLARLAERNPNVRLIAQRLEPRVRAGLQPGRGGGGRRACSCCSTTTPRSAPAGSDGSRPTSSAPGSGWSARPRTGPATRPRSTPTTGPGASSSASPTRARESTPARHSRSRP